MQKRRKEPLKATEAAERSVPSSYPEPFASRMSGRRKQPLGSPFGLANFAVNRTTLEPGAASALHHAHRTQDEFIYVLEGSPTLITDDGRFKLAPGDCFGFRAGTGEAHHLINETDADAVFLEVGDRSDGDQVTYPEDDLEAHGKPEGGWSFTRKDGTSY